MGFVLKTGVQVRKSVIPLLRTCFRSLFRHPFLVGFMLFLTFLYRFFPFAFSLLVIASPVLVCSVVLLGTLLIFGQTNLPETERVKKTTHDFGEAVTLERKMTFSMDKFLGKNVDEVSCSRYSSDPEGSMGYVPLIDETSHYTESKKREFDSNDLERVIRNEKLGIVGMTRDFREDSASFKSGGDHSESSQGGVGGDDEASDSGSTESWLPDAPIEDILPILDELHPLLDIDVPLHAPMTTDDSVGSDTSNDGSNESDDDTEIQGRGVQKSEVDKAGGIEDESKSAIKWTDDDQMNLRDLGNLELERNQCLENHITRRRESKSYSLAAEKNLIDLDTSDNPFNVAQILTTRHNAFDLSHDFYDDMPIPGSAPSDYVPRRNPFDLQYELNEENPELKGDHVEQESVSSVPNNTIFSRHESLRPSRLGNARQDLQWRPVFVPEQLTSEGTSYYPFRRPPSDSKLSSILDTESQSSGEDLDEKKFNERVKEAEVISNIYQPSDLVDHRRHSSEDLYHLETEPPEENDVQHGELEIKSGQVENGNASLSGTGEFVIPVEPSTSVTYLEPEAFEDKSSNRSSLSSSLEVDEKSSDLRKDGSNTFEPFETEQQTRSGMVGVNQNEEPVYDASPPGSAKVLSFDSIPTDVQAEISEVVPLSSVGNGRDSGECSRLFLPDVHEDLPKNLNVKAAFPDSSPRYDSPIYMTPTTEIFSSDTPSFDDHTAFPESPLTILSKSKEDSSIKDVNAVGVQDPGLKNLLPTSATSTSSNKASDVQQTINTHTTIEQVLEANVGEQTQPSNIKDKSPKVETSTKGSIKEIASSNTETGVKEPVATPNFLKKVSRAGVPGTPPNSPKNFPKIGVKQPISTTSLKKVSGNNDPELTTPSIFKDGSTEEGTKTNSAKKVPKANDRQNSDRSTEFGTSATGSTKDITSTNIGTAAEETVTTRDALKQVSEEIVGELFKVSNPKDGSTDVGNNTMGTPKDITLGSTKSSELKDGSTKVPNTVISTKNDQELITTKQASEGNNDEIPQPTKDGSTEVGTNVAESTKKLAPSNSGASVQESISTQTETNVAEDSGVKMAKSSSLKDELPKPGVDAVSSTKDTPSSNTESGIQKSITTAEGDVVELPRPSNSEGHVAEVSKPSMLEESNAGELPKPKIPKESDAVESQKPPDPKESNAGELQNPPESKGWLWW